MPYAWAALLTVAAAFLRAALTPWLADHYPLGTFYAAVAVVGWCWGVGPAVLCALLGYVLGAYFFLTPQAAPLAGDAHLLELSAYAAICGALIALVYRVYERQRQLDRALADQAAMGQALIDSDARFKRYLDAMPDIVFIWKADGAPDYVNPQWAAYLGARHFSDEVLAAHVPEEDLMTLLKRRDEALWRGEPLKAELRLRDRHGRERWFLMRCVPIRDPEGSITGWVGTAIDIDEEKRAREAVELSERRYRAVGEAFDFGIWSKDVAGRYTFASPRLLEFLGTTLEGTESAMWAAVQASESEIREAKGRWERSKSAGVPWDWEFSFQGQDGGVRRVWSRAIPLLSAGGRLESWAGVNLDVTERYTAATARDQALQRLEVVTRTMSAGVAQCNRQLEYVWANPAYARIIGLPLEGIQGRRIDEVLPAATFARLEPCIQRVLRGETVEIEGEVGAGEDPGRWIHVMYTPIWNGAPAPVGFVAVINDLTQHRALEEQLREANRRKDEFVATLAHELRNPLAPIRYATQLMKPGTPPQMADDARRMIDRQLEHMARLLDDLLDVSRITRGALEIRRDILDLRAALKHAIGAARPLAAAVEQTLELEVPDYPLPVRGDETRLIQVIGNLLNNSIKFTSTGGSIAVTASADNAEVLISVRDNGRGISPDLLPRVFEMFVQGERDSRVQSGLGIGLPLARQMIALHGGRIEAHSEGPGRGSEFRILLPRATELPAMQETVVRSNKVAVLGAGNVRILIVDDNVDAANSLAHLLKLAGYQPRVAYDGRTALEMAEILKPEVVLLDLGLPHLSGHEVAQRLRTLPWGSTARLIALTGWGQEDDMLRSRQAGFDEHFTKPVDSEVLLNRIIALTRGEAQAAG